MIPSRPHENSSKDSGESISTGLFIGRFQPLHIGHHHAIQRLQQQYHLVLGIGSSEQMNTFENPLSYHERDQIVQHCFPGLRTFPIPDQDSDAAWVRQIVEMIDFDTAISGEPVTRRCFADRNIPVEHPPYHRRDRYHATYVREKAAQGDQSWKQLVPDCSQELLERFNFMARMRSIGVPDS